MQGEGFSEVETDVKTATADKKKMGNYSYFRKQLRGKNVFSAKGNIFVIYSDIVGVARCCRNYPFVLFSWS